MKKDLLKVILLCQSLSIQATYLILKKPINTLFYLEAYTILLGLVYVGYKYKTKESKIGN